MSWPGHSVEPSRWHVNSPFKNHGELYSDTIHPNDAGYGLIAKTVCQAIGGGCQ